MSTDPEVLADQTDRASEDYRRLQKTRSTDRVDRSVEEAALSLGARPLIAALKVTLPLIWPGVVAAALFSFVVSFGNLEISLLLVAPGHTTLPIAILQYLQWKIDPTIAAVSALQTQHDNDRAAADTAYHAAQGCVGCHEDPERTPPNRMVPTRGVPVALHTGATAGVESQRR